MRSGITLFSTQMCKPGSDKSLTGPQHTAREQKFGGKTKDTHLSGIYHIKLSFFSTTKPSGESILHSGKDITWHSYTPITVPRWKRWLCFCSLHCKRQRLRLRWLTSLRNSTWVPFSWFHPSVTKTHTTKNQNAKLRSVSPVVHY